jgi:hypothetical protein
MKYPVEIGLCVMIYVSSFVKFGSAIHELIKGDSQTHEGDRISLL